MNINEQFPSNYIKAGDLKGNEWTLTMDRVEIETLGQDTKPVLYFREADKGLVLNRTNAMTIDSYFGPDTDAWAGKQLILYPVKVPFQGQMHDAVRVRARTGSRVQHVAPATQPSQPPAKTHHEMEPPPVDDFEDSIPF